MFTRFCGAALALAICCLPGQESPRPPVQSKLAFRTSDPALQAAFDWAKAQALQYVSPGGDPVGDWYEAALPKREAFCMRDVSHQAMGAHVLGLHRHNRNMLYRFAENISESKDWCSYWEIDRHNKPVSVDYRSDSDFWYNLPANFDVLDACFRLYLWSGDRVLIDDPTFANFHKRTVTDYVARWDLGMERIVKRRRIMNLRGDEAQHKFLRARGIPSYEEQQTDFVCGVDLVAAQVAAYRSYARMQALKRNAEQSKNYFNLAERTRSFLNTEWWDQATGGYHSVALSGGGFAPGQLGLWVLYLGASDEQRQDAAIDAVLRRFAERPVGIETESHIPETLYTYGRSEKAYDWIIDLSSPGKKRREYPEVSYAVLGAIINGAMGIEPDASRVQRDISWRADLDGLLVTLPRLTTRTEWAEITNVPFRDNLIAVRHDGVGKTTVTNLSGPPLRWRGCLPGQNLKTTARLASKSRPFSAKGMTGLLSCADIIVPSGRSAVVSAR